MKKINTYFTLNVDIECPYCNHNFNLFDLDKMKEDSYLYRKLMPTDEAWCDAGMNFNLRIRCLECKKDIFIKNIYY